MIFKSIKVLRLSSWRVRLPSLKSLCSVFFLLSLGATLILGNLTSAQAQFPRSEIRGVWLTNNDTPVLRDRAKVQEAVTKLAQLNFNTLYPVVWNSGYALYPSAIAQSKGIQPFVRKGLQGQDILADLIQQAHTQGLLVIPWFEFGFMVPPTSELALKYPQWLTQKRDGGKTSISAAGEVMWLNPLLPEVQQFITQLVLEIVTQYDVDGIQFDDHMSLPNTFGYDNYTTALYKKETKRSPHPDPQNPAWVRWRANKITAFMTQLQRAVKAKKPKAIFSVSPASYDFAYKSQLQDWVGWVRLNIVDELIVQVYHPDYGSFVDKISRSEILEAQQKIPTGIGILTGLRNQPIPIPQIENQVRNVQARGLGVAFFYYESLWQAASESLAQRQSVLQSFFPIPAPRVGVQ
jgi:uncharacterized lipoprotein YddW (UPF0748 family)